MSTLFFIGNGFDINCGMKTSYRNVYEKYIEEPSATKCISEFKDHLHKHIDNWGDFEMAMAGYAGCLNNEDEFLECVRDFAAYMESYLMEERNKFNEIIEDEEVYTKVKEEINNSLSNFYKGISHNVDRTMSNRGASYITEMYAVTFNYTDVFDKFFGKHIGNMKKIVHIHGELGDGPVFGVDNVEQIKAEFQLSRKGKRGFVKPIFNEQYDIHRVEIAQRMINSVNTICVYGMSLGDSDLSWRNAIFQWLKNDEFNHLFIYRFNLSNIENKTVAEKLDMEEDEKDRILDEWGIDDKESIIERIHIPCGKNIFNVKEVICNALKIKNKRLVEDGAKFATEQLDKVVLI